MNRGLVIGLATVGVIVAIVGGVVMTFVGSANTANRYEQGIQAQDDQMKNSLSSYSTGLVELLQVPEIYKADFIEVAEASIGTRYGADGVQGAFVAIQEAYPGNFDSSMYTRVMDRITAGRANFANEQKILIDRVREYQVALGTIPTGFFMSTMGYPRIDFDDYTVIADQRTQEIFRTRTDEAIKLRP